MPSVTGTSMTAQVMVHVAVGDCPCWDMLSTAHSGQKQRDKPFISHERQTLLNRLARASQCHLTDLLSLRACITEFRCHPTSLSE